MIFSWSLIRESVQEPSAQPTNHSHLKVQLAEPKILIRSKKAITTV